MNDKAKTVHEWSAEGLSDRQGQQFSQDIQHIAPLKLFVRALPRWSLENETGVLIKITSAPKIGGVGIEFGFDRKNLSVKQANELTERLIDTSRLMALEELVETMRGLGVDPSIINPLVDEANLLAAKLEGDE